MDRNVTFTVLATGAAPLSYQWRKSSSIIANQTNTSYTISNILTNDAGNCDVVVSNSVSSVTSSVATLIVTVPVPPSTNAGIIAQWNFNSTTPDGSVSTGTTTPSAGTGTAASVGGTTTSFASGNSTDHASTDNSGWSTTGYPSQTGANKSAGVQFNLSTAGKQNIAIRWDQRSSNTGSKYARLQYSTNGATFTDFKTAVTMTAGSTYYSLTNSLSGVPGVDNNPNFAFRIVTEWQSTATGSGTSGFVAANTSSTYASGGTVRFDMVTVSAEPLGTAPTITAQPTNLTVVVGDLASSAVSASGTAPLNYQWRKTGADLTGQTNNVLSLASVTAADAAGYDAVVNNAYGRATSAVATLTVQLPPTLQIHLQGTNVVLAWPASAGAYQLLFATNLASGWKPEVVLVVTNGATATATIPATNTQRFYRLQRIAP